MSPGTHDVAQVQCGSSLWTARVVDKIPTCEGEYSDSEFIGFQDRFTAAQTVASSVAMHVVSPSGWRLAAQQLLQPPNEMVHVAVEVTARTHIGSIAVAQLLQARRQRLWGGDVGAPDEDGNHTNVTLQGRFDLDTDEVGRVVEPALTFARATFMTTGEPAIANHRQQHPAAADGSSEELAEIDADGNAVHIDENTFAAEVGDEAVSQPSGRVDAVLAAIRNEYAGSGHGSAGRGGRRGRQAAGFEGLACRIGALDDFECHAALIFRIFEFALELFEQRIGIIDRLEPDFHAASGQILKFAGELISNLVILVPEYVPPGRVDGHDHLIPAAYDVGPVDAARRVEVSLAYPRLEVLANHGIFVDEVRDIVDGAAPGTAHQVAPRVVAHPQLRPAGELPRGS